MGQIWGKNFSKKGQIWGILRGSSEIYFANRYFQILQRKWDIHLTNGQFKTLFRASLFVLFREKNGAFTEIKGQK